MKYELNDNQEMMLKSKRPKISDRASQKSDTSRVTRSPKSKTKTV